MHSIDHLKEIVVEAIEGPLGDALVDFSLDLHAHPETAFKEKYALEAVTRFLDHRGFKVLSGIGDLETAFEARLQTGSGVGPTVAILAEFDALPELGHACGHNVIAAAGLGAFVALSSAGNLPGTVRLIGTPAEEDGGGKVIMEKAGIFSGIDAAMMIHPFSKTYPFVEFAGRVPMTITFHGRSAHAGGAPEMGINALDAAILFFNGIASLRSRLTDGARLHGVIAEGGHSPAVIPERSKVELYLRAYDQRYLQTMVKLVEACAQGAAAQVGCTVEVTNNAASFESFICHAPLANAFSNNLKRLGLDFEPETFRAFAATDFGNVSQKTPSIHPYMSMGDGLVCHTHEFARASGDGRGMSIVRNGAKAMAMTALDVLFNPSIVRL